MATKREIGAIATAGGARFVDAAIIGFPPQPGEVGPAVHLSGEAARDAAVLKDLGLNAIVMAAPGGAASAPRRR